MTASSGLALAQSSGQTESRLLRLENEIQTLSRAIYRGEMPSRSQNYGNNAQPQAMQGEYSALSRRLTGLENELRRLIGQIEEQGHKIRQLEQQQNIPVQQDNRFQEAPTLNTPVTEFNPAPQPPAQQHQLGTLRQTDNGQVTDATMNGTDLNASRLYDQAFAALQSSDYTQAENRFFTFLEQYGDSPLAANAQYWLAETQFIQGDFDGASRNFALGYQQYPSSPKAPDNLLKLGISLGKLDRSQEACVTFQELFGKYPSAPRSLLDKALSEQQSLNCG